MRTDGTDAVQLTDDAAFDTFPIWSPDGTTILFMSTGPELTTTADRPEEATAMASITNRITIHRPIEDVFAVLTDVEKTGTWFPGDVEEHWTTPPPRGVGSTRHAIVRMGGRQSENDAVVTEYDPPHRAAMAGTTPNAQFLVTLEFAREGDATHVEVTSATGTKGLMRIGGPIFLVWYRRAWDRGLETAKRMMEAGEL